MRTKIFSVVVCCLLWGAAVQAQEFWQKKQPAEWSETQCRKLFSDSPWAKQHEVSFNAESSFSSRGNVRRSQSDASSPQTGQSTGYVVTFWSAPPVRQAYVQMTKIRSHYDKLPADKRAAADADFERILGQQFPDSIVLRVSFYSSARDVETALANYWQQQSLQSMKNAFYLIVHGQRISPVNFAATPNDLTLVFPRLINNEPVVKPGDKALAFEFTHPPVAGQSESRVFMEFQMKKMLDEKGQLVF